MFYSFNYCNSKRAAEALGENIIHSLGGFERHTFRMPAGLFHVRAEDCILVTKKQAREIEQEYADFCTKVSSYKKSLFLEKIRNG